MITFNVIGPGRVGLALAKALIQTHAYQLLGVHHPTQHVAQNAVNILKQGNPIVDLPQLPKADITFITTQDKYIEAIANQLNDLKCLKSNSIIIHASGIHGANILGSVKKQGCTIGSFHPLKAFTKKSALAKHPFKDVDCTIEGDEIAVHQLTKMGQALNANVFIITPNQKATYHAAATIASNYLITLAAVAVPLFTEAGIPLNQAKSLCERLMQSSLNNLKQAKKIENALTGPLSRGDIETIHQHLQALPRKHLRSLYQIAGLVSLPLIKLDEELKQTLTNLLQEKH